MRRFHCLMMIACLVLVSSLRAQPASMKVVDAGIAVEFDLPGTAATIAAGSEMRLRFRVSDTASGNPLPGLRPAAWVDLRRAGDTDGAQYCTKKAASFLSGSLLSVPTIDLNAWFVLAMNEDASIAVVNPRFGFGGSRLLARVVLDTPGQDWVLSEDQKRLFVTMPESGKVAVIDTATWQVMARLELPSRPERIALQADEKYLWVTHRDGVVVFDHASLAVVARISTAAGPHELAFSAASRFAFVANRAGNSVTVIDVATLKKVADVAVGPHPSSITFSTQSQLAYIADDEGIVALNPQGEVVARIHAAPGIRQIRAAPGGRFLFAVNPDKNQLHVIDASSNRLVQTGIVQGGPDQVTYTSKLAYIRRRADATVLMVPLDQIGAPGAALPLVDFTGGHLPFGKGKLPSVADSIVPVPGVNAVLVANPADRAVYYYEEGAAAPMGQFNNYSREPRAVMVVNLALQEGLRGVYQTSARAPQPGTYDVTFFLDSPRMIHCFELKVASANGAVLPLAGDVSIVASGGQTVRPGEVGRVRFQIRNAKTQIPVVGLHDLKVLMFLHPGTWQTRQQAGEISPGTYEFQFTPPSSGMYQTHFESPSIGLKFNSPHHLTVAIDDRAP